MDSDSRLIQLALDEVSACTSPDDVLPSALSGYRLLSEVHRGTQGVVYEAVQESTGRTVAVKVMRHGPLASAADRFRFEREIKILGQLEHPNIVSVHDTGSSSGCSYFVMDFVRGQPLDGWVRAEERSIPEIVRLFVTICDAVGAAHLRGIIHRDLKPGNIRVDARGEPHVLDFGLAKVEDEGEAPGLMTTTGQFVGSLPWSAPEQASGATGAIDVRTDVYALGVILYQLLCRRFPYAVTGNLRDVLDSIQTSEPVRPRSVRPDVDDELQTIVLTCLAKDKARRYQTAGELQRDLVAYLTGDPIRAKGDSGWYVFRKQLRRHRVAVGVAAAFVLLVTAGFLTCLAFWQRAERHRADAEVARNEAEDARAFAEADAAARRRVSSFYGDVLDSVHPQPVWAVVLDDSAGAQRPDDVRLAGLLQDATLRVRERFSDAPALEAEVRHTLGRALLGVGDVERAEHELRVAFEVRDSTLGADHPETLDAALWLGEAAARAGDPDEVERILRPTIVRMSRVYGSDEPQTLRARQTLGFSMAAEGHLEDGVRMLIEVHEASRLRGVDGAQLAWSTDPQTFSLYTTPSADGASLGRALQDARERARRGQQLAASPATLVEGERQLRRAHAEAVALGGPGDIDALVCRQDLAVAVAGLGRVAEADALLDSVLVEAVGVLSEDDARLATLRWAQSDALRRMGRNDEALEMLRAAAAAFARILGEDDATTRAAYRTLAEWDASPPPR